MKRYLHFLSLIRGFITSGTPKRAASPISLYLIWALFQVSPAIGLGVEPIEFQYVYTYPQFGSGFETPTLGYTSINVDGAGGCAMFIQRVRQSEPYDTVTRLLWLKPDGSPHIDMMLPDGKFYQMFHIEPSILIFTIFDQPDGGSPHLRTLSVGVNGVIASQDSPAPLGQPQTPTFHNVDRRGFFTHDYSTRQVRRYNFTFVPAITGTTVASGTDGGNFLLNWNSITNTAYQIQSSVDLGTWANEGSPITGNGNQMSWSAPIASGAKFYRLLISP